MTNLGTGLFLLLLAVARVAAPFPSLYARYAEAVKRMDVDGYLAFFTDDFSMTSPNGKVHDRAEMAEYLKVNAETTKKVRNYTVELLASRKLDDGDVEVLVLQKYDRDQAPREAPEEPHRIQTSVVQRETWRKTKSGWRIRRIEELLVGPLFIDGKMQAE